MPSRRSRLGKRFFGRHEMPPDRVGPHFDPMPLAVSVLHMDRPRVFAKLPRSIRLRTRLTDVCTIARGFELAGHLGSRWFALWTDSGHPRRVDERVERCHHHITEEHVAETPLRRCWRHGSASPWKKRHPPRPGSGRKPRPPAISNGLRRAAMCWRGADARIALKARN